MSHVRAESKIKMYVATEYYFRKPVCLCSHNVVYVTLSQEARESTMRDCTEMVMERVGGVI